MPGKQQMLPVIINNVINNSKLLWARLLDLKGGFKFCGCCNRNKDYNLICNLSSEFWIGRRILVSRLKLELQEEESLGTSDWFGSSYLSA
jgi:hypothetical protein